MKKLLLLLSFFLLIIQYSDAQTITASKNPIIANQPVTFTADLTGNEKLENLSEAWAWVWVPDGPGAVTNVSPATSAEDAAKWTKLDNNKWEITFTPTIFIDADAADITSIGLILKGRDWSDGQTEDFIFNVSQENVLTLTVLSPITTGFIAEKGDIINFKFSTTKVADIKLKINNVEIHEIKSTQTFDYNYTVVEEGEVNVNAIATSSAESHDVPFNYFVKPADIVKENRPVDATLLGANYKATSVTLVLQDPAKKKEFVYAIGDFNNWETHPDQLMKLDEQADANYWWITINNLDPNKEYIYQYLIDGTLRVADPYTEKVSDPYDDKYINQGHERYPNLIAYPEGKTSFRASVLQINQPEYTWKNNSFSTLSEDELFVYEMHIRDFTDSDTYKEALTKLDYIQDLGANCIHLMPINEFEGNDSWGYNPNFYFAPDKYYGTKNDLKEFIDEAHGRGIAVIIDIVMNHSFHSSPLVRMYNTGDYGDPTSDNPWYNVTSPNQTYQWGADFNHESEYTKALLDSINSHWINNYHVDGYRFDFTKGFTQKSGDGGQYDASRITILKRMADHIWSVKDDALVILEHLTPWEEEAKLANYKALDGKGMMMWTGGDLNHKARDGVKASNVPDLINFSHEAPNRNMDKPRVLAYMESHDEERLAYDGINNGVKEGNYNVKDSLVTLERLKLSATFMLMIPGPKMIWQFGELGYDVSINQKEKGGAYSDDYRVDRKPVMWEYKDNLERQKLYKVYQAVQKLRHDKGLDLASGSEVDLSNIGSNKSIKTISYNVNGFKVEVIGSYSKKILEHSYDYSSKSDKWFDYFNNGKEIDSKGAFSIAPGEVRIFISESLDDYPETDLFKPWEEPTSIGENKISQSIKAYPNPTSSLVQFTGTVLVGQVEVLVRDNIGRVVSTFEQFATNNTININLASFPVGMYYVELLTVNDKTIKKIIRQ